MPIDKNIKDGRLTSFSSVRQKSNAPKRYGDRQKRYYESENSLFISEYAKYSNDFVEAEVQGTDESDFYKYRKLHLRFAELVRASASMQRTFDNYKNIMIAERDVDFIPKGAKLKSMGNYWLSVNPQNMSGSSGMGVIQRCDATWNYLDYYGNVCSEPFCVDDESFNANDNDSQRSTMITKGYFTMKCQYNDVTKNLSDNSRIMVGTMVFRITGFSNISMQFTGDLDSIHIIEFTARYEEPNKAIDDFENHVAGGKTFAWDIEISGNPSVKVGETTNLSAISRRTSLEHTEIVKDTKDHNISYMWETSAPDIAVVSDSGAVTGISEGEATISVRLEQNPLKTAHMTFKVDAVNTKPHLEWTGNPPKVLSILEDAVISAGYFEDASLTNKSITWTFTGASDKAYSYEKVDDYSIKVKCWHGCENSLKVKASCENESIERQIRLEGF